MSFERAALGLFAGLFAILITVAVRYPLDGTTVAPRATPPAAEAKAERVPGGHAHQREGLGQREDMISREGMAARESASLPTARPAPARPPAAAGGGKAGIFSSRLEYDLDSVISGKRRVPRVMLARIPDDLGTLKQPKKRKVVFFKTVLPLILRVNEEILADRRRLWRLRYRMGLGQPLDAADRRWLAHMAKVYGVKSDDLDGLFRRVDAVPPSLALAQAAEESGWGTSRFVREGNAIFGQWTFSKSGALLPSRRDEGKNHGVKAFESLLDSVKAYVRNLNTHRAYAEFRKARAVLRRLGARLDGRFLAGTLKRYSQRGVAYVRTLRTIIDRNNLRRLDDARLTDTLDDREPVI